MLYTSKLATIFNRVIQTLDIAFITAVMQWGLRRQVLVIHVHHATRVLCNCSHTNKIRVQHTKKWLTLCVQNIWSLEGRLDYSSSLYHQITFHCFSKYGARIHVLNTLRTGSFKLFKHPFPGFLTILTL